MEDSVRSAAQDAASKKRGRSSSASPSADMPASKIQKVRPDEPSAREETTEEVLPSETLQGSASSLKRRRSASVEVDSAGVPVAKSARLGASSDTDSPELFPASSPSSPDSPPPSSTAPSMLPVGLELGGVMVTNLHMVSIDEHGREIRLTAPASSTTGLLSPDPTPPIGSSSLPDPFRDDTVRREQQIAVADPHAPQARIAIAGDAKLFGLLPARVLVYEHPGTSVQPYTDVMCLKTDAPDQLFSLGHVFPGLKDSPLDAIALKDPMLAYQAELLSDLGPGRFVGTYFETRVVFQGVLAPVSDFLRDFFNQADPGIRFSAWLCQERKYDSFLPPASIALQGSLDNISLRVLDVLEFRRLGIEVVGNQAWSVKEERMAWRLGYGFFGELNLSVPGTVMPLEVAYRLGELGGAWQLDLRLRSGEWTDIFGVKGLSLRDVVLSARLAKGSPGKKKLAFRISAGMRLRQSTLDVTGFYSQDSYSIEATLGNLTLRDVGEVFFELFGIHLDIFDHDVTFNDMSLCVSSEGVSLSGEVTINGHTSARARLAFTKDGIEISGGIGGLDIEVIGGKVLEIKEAGFDVFIASKLDSRSARATRLAIAGDVTFEGIEVKVGLYTEKSAKGEILWAVYGEVEGEMSTAKLEPALKGTFLDIELRRLALVAANHAAPSGKYPGIAYPVLKGIQFCAEIEGIHALEQLMRGSVKGMVLKAAYTEGKVALSIMMPAERTISFGDSVYSGPLEIALLIDGADTALMLQAVLNVKLDSQPEPLQFGLGLKASMESASAYAEMLNDWTNPCSIGQSVVVRKCVLEIGIVYKTFVASGMPGVLGIGGQLQVGSRSAGAFVKLSQNPKDQLLIATIEDLGVVDLVNFASLIAGEKLPAPDPGMLHFIDLEFYLSTGTSLGGEYHPAGTKLKGNMRLFGKEAALNASLDSAGLKLFATIQSFSLGPLTVRGAKKPDPVIDLELSKERQRVLIDGAVDIWDSSAALHLDVMLLPTPKLDFMVDLRLSELFLLKLEAKLSGQINLKDIKSWATADFEVYGLMEQRLVEYLVTQLEAQIAAAQDAARHGFDSVNKDLGEKEAAFKAGCQTALDKLEETRKAWQEKQRVVNGAFESAKLDTERTSRELQRGVDQAEQAWKALVARLAVDLERARSDANAAIRVAELGVQEAQRDSDETIATAQGDVQRAQRDFDLVSQIIQSDEERTQSAAESQQQRVNELNRDISNLQGRILREPLNFSLGDELLRLVRMQADAGTDLIRLRGLLSLAQAAVRGTRFVTAQDLVRSSERTLGSVRTVKTAALNRCQSTLADVRQKQKALVESAEQAMRNAETLSDELRVFNRAKELQAEGESVALAGMSDAQARVDDLAKCAEFLAFDKAEQALRFAQENTAELNLARHAVKAAESGVNLGLDASKWAAQHGGTLFNIRKVEFQGSVGSLLRHEEGVPKKPLMVHVEGVVMEEKILFHIEWKPEFDLVRFIKELFASIWAKIQQLVKEALSLKTV